MFVHGSEGVAKNCWSSPTTRGGAGAGRDRQLLALYNCLVIGNRAGSLGGGIFMGNNVNVYNCTVEDNEAGSTKETACASSATAALMGSVVYYNGLTNIYAEPIDGVPTRTGISAIAARPRRDGVLHGA